HTHELYLDPAGNLYGEHLWYEGEAINKWDYYVWRRSPDGRVQTIYGPKREFRTDYSLVRDAAGNHYWADREHHAIMKNQAVLANSTLPWSVVGGTYSTNGDLWLLEWSVGNEARARRAAVPAAGPAASRRR